MTPSNELSGRTSEPQRVLVTGATGQQGGALARLLLRRGHQVRALTRKPDGPAATELKKAGADVLPGDLGDPASVERAAKGFDVAFLVATPFEQGPAVEARWGKAGAEAVHAAGVPYLVYSSVSDADRNTGIPHFDSKLEVERRLKELGLDHAIVAPVFFMENFRSPRFSGGYAHGVVALGIPANRKLQVISLPEIAEFTTLAIERRAAFRGKRFNLASDELTPVEMAREISEAAGVRLSYTAVPLDEVRKQSADSAKMFEWFDRVGYSADIPKLKRDYPGVEWTSFRAWSRAQDWSRLLPRPGPT